MKTNLVVKNFFLSNANICGMALGGCVELLHIFDFIDSTGPIWALVAYGLGFVLMHTPSKGKCPKDISILEKIEWANLSFLKASEKISQADAKLDQKITVLAVQLEKLYKEYDSKKLENMSYAKAHVELTNLIETYFVPAVETYISLPVASMATSTAKDALVTQLELIDQLRQKLTDNLVNMPLQQITSKTAQLQSLINQKEAVSKLVD